MRIKTRDDRRQRIKYRIRKRVAGDQDRPRLTVFRSLSHIYAQVIDDMTGTTVVSAATTEPALKKDLSGKTRGGNIAGAPAVSVGASRRPSGKCVETCRNGAVELSSGGRGGRSDRFPTPPGVLRPLRTA